MTLNVPTVHLVGAGPGDPELLTLKALRAIRAASVLLVDDLVGDGVLRHARKSARIVHVGKRGGCASTPQGTYAVAQRGLRRAGFTAQLRRCFVSPAQPSSSSTGW